MKIPNCITIAAFFTIVISGGSVPAATTSYLVDVSEGRSQEVRDAADKKIGTIQKVLVDHQNGVVRFVVVEVDKEWSFDDPLVAVPWPAFDVKTEHGGDLRVTLDATKEQLQRAPRYMDGDANRLSSQETAQPIYEYWGVLWLDVSQTQSSQPAAEGSPAPQTQGSSSSRPTPASGATTRSAASPTMSPLASPTPATEIR